MRCPNCWRDEDIGSAPFRLWDLLFLPMMLWPFKCYSCDQRFHRFLWAVIRYPRRKSLERKQVQP